MSFSVFEKIDPSCQNGSMEKAKNIPYHQRPYASIAERTLVDISIYSPRPQIAGTGHSHSKISIHSPRMGRDDARYYGVPQRRRNFNPLSPHGERRSCGRGAKPTADISIHSPRMGRDAKAGAERARHADFNPLSPHGERPIRYSAGCWRMAFQSTLPAWGETEYQAFTDKFKPISIHSPRMGRDRAPRGPTPGRC